MKRTKAPATRRGSGSKKTTTRIAPVEAALAAFAHDVRTPLTGILALGELLATAGLPERERQWAETIRANAEHLAALTTVMVDAASERHGSLALREDVFDLGALVRAAAQSLSGRAAAKGLKVRVALPPAFPAVAGDPVRLRAALENLLDNAVKFTGRGHVALRVTVARRGRGSIALRFTVSDTGIGLKPAEIRRLFRPFSQASVATARRFGGAGLGLAAARQLARAMGGDLQAVTKRGGAEFVLDVKLRRVAAAPPGGSARHRAVQALDVLCVEDSPFGRVVLNAVLRELGHRAAFAPRGEDAVETAAARAFDAALVDMVLPGIDGVETIRRLRAGARGKSLRIVGLSGRERDRRPALAAGADDFMVKPVSPRALAQALAR